MSTERIAADLAVGVAYKRFIIQRETWYYTSRMSGSDVVEELGVGIDSSHGGTYGEWTVGWHRLGASHIAPKVEVFSDGWAALSVSGFADVLEPLGENFSLPELTEALLEAGWRDETQRTGPEAKPVSLSDRIATAIGDPGSLLDRQDGESITRWSTRAVMTVLDGGAS